MVNLICPPQNLTKKKHSGWVEKRRFMLGEEEEDLKVQEKEELTETEKLVSQRILLLH